MHSSYTHNPPGALSESPPPEQEYDNTNASINLKIDTPSPLVGIDIALQRWITWRSQFFQDENLRHRVLTHMTMLVVVVLALGLGQFDLSWGTISAIRPIKYNPLSQSAAVAEISQFTLPTQLNNDQNGVLTRAAVPNTIFQDRSQDEQASMQTATDLRSYAVESGDTISSIADKFGLSPETIIWSNPTLADNPDWLSIGQELTILPVDGIYHQVGGNDTISAIASTFKTDSDLIINHPLNDLDPANPVIVAGQWLVIPGGRKPFKPRAVIAYSGSAPADATAGTGIFGWPASGSISQGYFGYHPGIDIAGWNGAPVSAADSGYVIAAGWDGSGYGISIVIDHGNGFQTLYAHLQDYHVSPGDNVSKGQQIGEMGTTGNSTGPHLHFEVRHGTVQRNPHGFLP